MIGPTASGGTLLAQLADSSASVQRQLDTALAQQASGKVSTTYAGLGTAVRTSLDLRPAAQHQQVWQDNVDAVSSRLETTQTTLKQISDIAANFYAQTNNLNGIGDSVNDSEAASVGIAAKAALAQVAQLLNTKDGAIYVFAGQDTANPPIPNTDPAVVGADLLASDTATPPFSATIGSATPQVEIGEGQQVQAGILANQNTLATSSSPTTGSYMRDIMRALATLATVTNATNGAAIQADTRARLSSAIGAIATESGALGNVQSTLQSRQTALASTQIALNKQGLQRRRCRHGQDHHPGLRPPDPAASLLPDHCRTQGPLSGQLPDGLTA